MSDIDCEQVMAGRPGRRPAGLPLLPRIGTWQQRLQFAPELEAQFRRDRVIQYLLITRVVLFAAVILYYAGVWIDSLVFGRMNAPWITTIAYLVLAPATALALMATFIPRLHPYLTFAYIVLCLITGPLMVLVMVTESKDASQIAFLSLILHLLYVFFLLGLLFWQSLALGTLSYVMLLSCDALLNVTPTARFDHAYFISAVIFIGAMVAFLQEKTQRLAWLQTRQLEHLSNHDALTGLLNHAAFFVVAQCALKQARRDRRSVAALFCDLDHFKRVNDAEGHAIGDDCLRRVTAVARTMARRPLDQVGRLGGEEFAMLLYDVTPEWAQGYAETLRARIEALEVPRKDGTSFCVTVSVGLACLAGGSETTAEALIDQADAALYRAKAEGRNCVRVGTAPVPEL